MPAGWGDIAVAVGAALLIVLAPPSRPGSLPLIRIWNALGLIDILGVVLTAARLGESNPEGPRPLLRLPLNLLLTFVVPLIIASHVLIALRLGRASAGRAG